MKRFLLWSFERGSKQYDVICALILAFIFLTPPSIFKDRPDFMRVSSSDEPVRRSMDDNGKVVYTVKVDSPAPESLDAVEKQAIDRLHDYLRTPFVVARTKPIYNTSGALLAYAIWIDTGGQSVQ